MVNGNTKGKSLRELYKEETRKPSRAQEFIALVAQVTHRSEHSVKMWLLGKHEPDELVKSTLAEYFKCDPQTLFPAKEK